ncbi:hypothetical protein CDAR_463781 [Caerostris darwini]|uniref:Uncharacterized protein n=1 Tax=Caerostris darwini TaxID=1538125 RepID=A0AAV4W3A8_9ARAC|nr:hypothetical protein CDAR_463781 [Caerostris darwini]
MVTSKFRSVKCTNFRVWNFHGITRTRKRHANWVPTRKGFVLVYSIRRVGKSIENFITWKVISKLHRPNFWSSPGDELQGCFCKSFCCVVEVTILWKNKWMIMLIKNGTP